MKILKSKESLSTNENNEKKIKSYIKSFSSVLLATLLTTWIFSTNQAYSATISWEQLENYEKQSFENFNITNISWYIKVDEIWWFADWKYNLKSRKIKRINLSHLSFHDEYWKKITIWLKNPFILSLKFEKKKKRYRIPKKLNLLFDIHWNNLIFLWIIFENKIYPLMNPKIYKIKKIEKIIENINWKWVITNNGEQIIKLNIPSFEINGIKWGKIFIKLEN